MSNLSQKELDRVLEQLIDQTAPDRPSDVEAQAVVEWAEGVRIEQVMLDMVLAGKATVRIVDNEPQFQLTPQGMVDAERLLVASPEARAFHDKLVADAVGKPLSKEPDGKQ